MIAHVTHNANRPRGRKVVELTFWQAGALLVAAQPLAQELTDQEVLLALKREHRELNAAPTAKGSPCARPVS